MSLVTAKLARGKDEESLRSQRAKLAEVRRLLAKQWAPRRMLRDVQVRTTDESTLRGFVSLSSGETGENFLLDFEATFSQGGALSSMSVDGKKVPVSAPGRRGRRA